MNRYILILCLAGTMCACSQIYDPSGLYRLQYIGYENGETKVPIFEQYKYCGKDITLHLNVDERTDSYTDISVIINDSLPFKYTGRIEDDKEGNSRQIFDCDKNRFTLKWYNDRINKPLFPQNTFINEYYDKKINVESDVRTAIDMLEHKQKPGKGKFYGSWKRVGHHELRDGNLVPVDELGSVYQIIRPGNILSVYTSKEAKRPSCLLVIFPFVQLSDTSYIQNSEHHVEWIGADKYQSRLINPETGKATEMDVWERSELPQSFIDAFRKE